MAWEKDWTQVEGYCSDETLYEKKYYQMGGVDGIPRSRTPCSCII